MNFGAIVRRIRRCETEIPAQLVLEHALNEAATAEREACIAIVEKYKVPVGNSAAGEMACEWTMDALREIRDEMLKRSNAE